MCWSELDIRRFEKNFVRFLDIVERCDQCSLATCTWNVKKNHKSNAVWALAECRLSTTTDKTLITIASATCYRKTGLLFKFVPFTKRIDFPTIRYCYTLWTHIQYRSNTLAICCWLLLYWGCSWLQMAKARWSYILNDVIVWIKFRSLKFHNENMKSKIAWHFLLVNELMQAHAFVIIIQHSRYSGSRYLWYDVDSYSQNS